MEQLSIQGGVEILLVALYYRNRDELRPDGPLGSYADFTFYSSRVHIIKFDKNIYCIQRNMAIRRIQEW